MVRLHLSGFYWGDASLSNTLFDLHSDPAAACLMHAEPGKLYPEISSLLREYDLQIAKINMAAELMDLLEGGLIEDDLDPIATSELIAHGYMRLWAIAMRLPGQTQPPALKQCNGKGMTE